jgi:endonuclease YncB( thermonuclease family)
MQILRILSLAAVAAAAYRQGIARPEVVEVRAVPDGHTIEVAGYGRVRLAGIRAPRPPRGAAEGEPYGRAARERLEGIVTHRFVRLEFPSGASQSAAYVLLEDGAFVNAILLRDGLARLTGRPTGTRGDELKRAQEEAIAARRGMWRRLTPRGAPPKGRRAWRGARGRRRRTAPRSRGSR